MEDEDSEGVEDDDTSGDEEGLCTTRLKSARAKNAKS